jgi:hypothetical protein
MTFPSQPLSEAAIAEKMALTLPVNVDLSKNLAIATPLVAPGFLLCDLATRIDAIRAHAQRLRRPIRKAPADCAATVALFGGGAAFVFLGAVVDARVSGVQAAEAIVRSSLDMDRVAIGLVIGIALGGVAALVMIFVSLFSRVIAPGALGEPKRCEVGLDSFKDLNALEDDIRRECERISYRAAIRDGMSECGRAALARSR